MLRSDSLSFLHDPVPTFSVCMHNNSTALCKVHPSVSGIQIQHWKSRTSIRLPKCSNQVASPLFETHFHYSFGPTLLSQINPFLIIIRTWTTFPKPPQRVSITEIRTNLSSPLDSRIGSKSTEDEEKRALVLALNNVTPITIHHVVDRAFFALLAFHPWSSIHPP